MAPSPLPYAKSVRREKTLTTATMRPLLALALFAASASAQIRGAECNYYNRDGSISSTPPGESGSGEFDDDGTYAHNISTKKLCVPKHCKAPGFLGGRNVYQWRNEDHSELVFFNPGETRLSCHPKYAAHKLYTSCTPLGSAAFYTLPSAPLCPCMISSCLVQVHPNIHLVGRKAPSSPSSLPPRPWPSTAAVVWRRSDRCPSSAIRTTHISTILLRQPCDPKSACCCRFQRVLL